MSMCVALPWVDLYVGRICSLSLLQLLCFARSKTNMLSDELVLQSDVVGGRLLKAIVC
jgi:hypothetical protein